MSLTEGKGGRYFFQGLLLSLVAVFLFFSLLEGGLYLFGVESKLRTEDPFVGFAANVPLFVERVDPGGRKVMVTAKNKLGIFNAQQFPLEKAPGTRRIFCLGGSTTYGRPYDDTTSFAGWLRELLPDADPGQRWEVINGGGVSYASYRVAQLMPELVRYQPDLFIIYTGHNEFLEERSYGALRDIPGPVKKTAALLARTRTWSAMSTVLDRLGVMPRAKQQGKVQMTGEVNTILDRSIGPQSYHRDAPLQAQILLHYRVSLERIVDIARSAGADVILVTPASNRKDCSPFKSEYSAGLTPTDQKRVAALLAKARRFLQNGAWSEALALLDQAVAIDPRFAESHYLRGRSLFALNRYGEAQTAFTRARDEDVCPLRALTPMRQIVIEVGREKDVKVVDFVDLLAQQVFEESGHRLPGADYFLDHVHPTIKGNRILAVALVGALAEQGIVHPAPAWGDEVIARVARRVEGGIDREEHALALVHLAKVLGWAGKIDDASRLAEQAMASGIKEPGFILEAAEIVASLATVREDYQNALKYYKRALEVAPRDLEIHFKMGLMYSNQGDFEKAAAHVLLVSAIRKNNDFVHQTLGTIMAKHGNYNLASRSLMEALRLNPDNKRAEEILLWMRQNALLSTGEKVLPRVLLAKYPSGMALLVAQQIPDSTGRLVNHGIETEWYEKGQVKRYTEYKNGTRHGIEILWNPDGKVVSRAEFKNGVLGGEQK